MGVETIIIAASAALSAGTAVAQGVAARRVAKENANIAELRAIQELQASKEQAELVRKNRTQQLAQARVAFGASGADISTGTPIDMLNSLSSIIEREVALVRTQGVNAATFLSMEALQEREQGSRLFKQSLFEAGSTILTAPIKLKLMKSGG